MKNVQRVGDEILYEGELVALLVQTGVTPSHLGRFTDVIDERFEEEDSVPADELKDSYISGLDDLVEHMKTFAKGGLVKMDDLKRIAEQLREEARTDR